MANAQQSGTPAEARAMLDRVVAALKTEFKATALSEFNDKNNKQFHDRDLYVFCNNMSDGKTTAHANAALEVAAIDAPPRKSRPCSFDGKPVPGQT